jgi:hypothetical protein
MKQGSNCKLTHAHNKQPLLRYATSVQRVSFLLRAEMIEKFHLVAELRTKSLRGHMTIDNAVPKYVH